MYSGAPSFRTRCESTCDEDSRVLALIRSSLEEYQLQELKAKKGRLEKKLADINGKISALDQAQERTSSRLEPIMTTLPKMAGSLSVSSLMSDLTDKIQGMYHADSLCSLNKSPSVSLNSLLEVDVPEEVPAVCYMMLDEINEQDARMRERRIIDFEMMFQEEEEGLEEFLKRLQYNVIAAYGQEATETLHRRVAWGFIKGLRDHPVRSYIVAQGWTTAEYVTMSPTDLLELADKSPVVKLEGLIKRKILQAPHDVKVDNKSWCSYYGVLKANTVYFYKDAKHYKRNESESACELSEDSTLHVDEDKKKGKLIKVCKKNGLEMLLRAGDKAPTVEDWLESLSSATGTPISSLHNNRSVSEGHIDSVNGHDSSEDRVDARSIIDSKDITKKTINNYLHNRPTKDAQKIVDILTHQGIDISHLDKEKKKKVLTQLLSTRPSLEDLQRKGLIKYTVFGCPLSSLCSRQRVQVPSVVTACVEAIEFRGLRSPGLYRISGNSAAIQKLRFKFDRCEDKYESINLKDQEFEINMLTGFLKLFLRELPEPVIPFSQYNGIAIAIRTEEQSPETAVQMLKHIVQNLPEPNKSTLIYLILHIVRVSNESSENQMDVHNLSIIFGPSLLGNQPDKANLLADLPVQNRAIELIISHYRTILR